MRYARGSHRWDEVYRPNLFVSTMPIPGTEGELVPDVDALAAAATPRCSRSRPSPATSWCTTRARCTRPAGTGPRRPGAGRSRSATAATTPGCSSAPARRCKPYQHDVADGAVLDSPDCPVVWRARHVEPVLVHRYPLGMDEIEAPGLRRRQPLLRGARRLHPPPRPEARAPLRAVGRDRRPQVPRGRRPGEPGGREPDLRPDRQGRRDARLLPRQPRRDATRSSSCASASRSGPSTATATPALARASTSRASRRSGCSRRSACSTRSC